MKTAMQELIEHFESNEIVYNKELILKLKELFEKEKQQIIDAHIEGQPLYSCQSEKAEKYYNQTYNQNK
jgi:hypothetical protein